MNNIKDKMKRCSNANLHNYETVFNIIQIFQIKLYYKTLKDYLIAIQLFFIYFCCLICDVKHDIEAFWQ